MRFSNRKSIVDVDIQNGESRGLMFFSHAIESVSLPREYHANQRQTKHDQQSPHHVTPLSE
jgi:hypothetical protein